MDDTAQQPHPDAQRPTGEPDADSAPILSTVADAEAPPPGAPLALETPNAESWPVISPAPQEGIGSDDSPLLTNPDDASTDHTSTDDASTAWTAPAEPLAVPADAPARPSAWRRIVAEVTAGVQTLFSAAVYATLIVTFGFQVARVDGLSMAPTLEDHDRLIVNKLVYELGNPRPGDIVMLYYPVNPDKMFVKRVIASEGDVVRIVDGHVYVNDSPLHDDYVPEEFRSHDDWGPTVIQQGYYFVMGDHRNNSSDSRHWGQVPKRYIVGKVKVRWWPLQDARIF